MIEVGGVSEIPGRRLKDFNWLYKETLCDKTHRMKSKQNLNGKYVAYTVEKIRSFTVKYLATSCQSISRYFYERLLVEHF